MLFSNQLDIAALSADKLCQKLQADGAEMGKSPVLQETYGNRALLRATRASMMPRQGLLWSTPYRPHAGTLKETMGVLTCLFRRDGQQGYIMCAWHATKSVCSAHSEIYETFPSGDC